MKKLFGFWLVLFLPLVVKAQQTYNFRQLQTVKVVAAGDTLLNAWAGGLNSPVFSKINLNNDGVEDLYVFERNSNKAFTFLADNSSGTWQWKYAPEYEPLFPAELENWVLLRDYDNDGRKDIFTGDGHEYYVYRNITPLNGNLAFAVPKALKYGNARNSLEYDTYSLPSLTDIDNDGDLDVLVFSANSSPSSIVYFKNQSKELYNHADSLKLIKVTDVWGNLRRCSVNHSYNNWSSIACKVSGIMHANGSSLLALDLDADGDKDLLSGLELNLELARFINDGTSAAPVFNATGFSLNFPVSQAANMVNYPTPYSEDVTFDGKNDLLVAPFLHDNSDRANMNHSAWLYRNDAFAPGAAPVFTFEENNFLQNEMIDVGETAMPVFADVDADGDQDLLVSNYADYRFSAASFKSSVSLFTNVGTATKPVFQLTDSDYLNFSAANNGAGYIGIQLQFGDINGDGSQDLILRYKEVIQGDPFIAFIPNSAQPNQPYSFNRVNQQKMAIDNLVDTDSPFFYDLDGDGDLDMLLGTYKQISGSTGMLHFHRRIGADVTQYASWEPFFNTNVGNINRNTNPIFISPLIADLNNDNVPELLTGDNSGAIRIYTNLLTNLNGTLQPQTDLIYSSFLTQHLPTAFGNMKGFGTRVNLHLAAADLDGDSKPELVVGTTGGGLIYLKNESVLSTGNELPAANFAIKLFPNPAAETVTVSGEKEMQLTLFDATGREIKINNAGFRKVQQIDVSKLKNGIYFLKATTSDFRTTGRSIIVQH